MPEAKMIFPEFTVSLFIAFLMTGIYMILTRKSGRRTGLIWLFLIIFLSVWAGGMWLKPFGPTMWGVHWLTFLIAGIVVILLFFIFIPRKPPRGRNETIDMLDQVEREKEIEEIAYITLSLFFWLLLAILIIAIVLRYTAGVNVLI